MFFDGFDIYIAATVLGATLKSGFSTLAQNALFVSATFVGMMLGSFVTGFLGDRYGRRFTYQANLLLFGLASLGAAFAPNMTVLITCRFIMGVGPRAPRTWSATRRMTEFVPARPRGRCLGLMAVFVVTGLPVASWSASVVIPASAGGRCSCSAASVRWVSGTCARRCRNRRAGSRRWAPRRGRGADADDRGRGRRRARRCRLPPRHRLAGVRARARRAVQPPPAARMIVGCRASIVINTLLYGFVTWLPTFFIQQGLSIATSFGYRAR